MKQSKKNAAKRIKGISKERFARLESWCHRNQIKALAKQLAREVGNAETSVHAVLRLGLDE